MYDKIIQLQKAEMFEELVKAGIIPITIAGYKLIYEVYLRERKKHPKPQAISNTSEETKTPERTIYRIVKKMES